MIKILVATPTTGMVRSRYVGSMVRLFSYFPNMPIEGRNTEDRRLDFSIIESSTIYQAREDFARDVLRNDYTHLLFVDDDMGFRENVLKMLIERDLPIVSCNYRMKVAPCPFTARSLDGKYWVETHENSTGLEQVLMNGFGFSLIKRETLEKLSRPMFLPYYTPQNEKYSTEDTPFFLQLKRLGVDVFIDHDASKLVYHVGTWSFGIDDNNFRAEQRLPFAERDV
jgi:hypothetical protein